MARSPFNVNNIRLCADSHLSPMYLTWDAPGERCHVWCLHSLENFTSQDTLLFLKFFEEVIYVNPPADVAYRSPRWFPTRKRSRTAKANARLFAFILEEATRTKALLNLRAKFEADRAEVLAQLQEVRARNLLTEAAPLLLEALVNQTNWFKATMLPLMNEQEQRIWAAEIGEPSDNAIRKATGDV